MYDHLPNYCLNVFIVRKLSIWTVQGLICAGRIVGVCLVGDHEDVG